jgi:hypothetical protein
LESSFWLGVLKRQQAAQPTKIARTGKHAILLQNSARQHSVIVGVMLNAIQHFWNAI